MMYELGQIGMSGALSPAQVSAAMATVQASRTIYKPLCPEGFRPEPKELVKTDCPICPTGFSYKAVGLKCVPRTEPQPEPEPEPQPQPQPEPEPEPEPPAGDIIPVDVGLTPQLVYLGQTGSGQLVYSNTQYIPTPPRNVQTTALAQFQRGEIPLEEPEPEPENRNALWVVAAIVGLIIISEKRKK